MRLLWAVLIVAALIRLVSLGIYPLADTTEARYGEIARLMAETGDWITPRLGPDEPFWGKPPLSFWLSAASMKIFGVNEFAARLPSWLLGVMVSVLVWGIARRQDNGIHALAALLILNTSAVFWISSGAVMTDHALLAGTTLCMAAFWRALRFPENSGRIWGYAFFVGLAMGLLAKGPVALVLIGLPIGGWTLLKWQWREVWHGLPWIFGLLLTAALTLPWYCLAEMRTPGFLEYFIIGEHWKRFLVPGWSGDLYGNAHLRPRGMIWLFWLVCALPWSMGLFLVFPQKIYHNLLFFKNYRFDGATVYFFLWSAAPMVFFTFSRNILPAYVLPGIPAFAILLARSMGFQMEKSSIPAARSLMWPAAAMITVSIMAVIVVSFGDGVSEKSQKDLVAVFEQNRKNASSQLIYLFSRPLSAGFYSAGKARLAPTFGEAENFLHNKGIDYFVVPKKKLLRIPPAFLDQVSDLCDVSGSCLFVEKMKSQIN